MLGILNDVKVLDLSQSIGGAFLAKLLADQGAETIKVEPPGLGDPTRHEPPFLGGDADPEKSSLYLAHNTNKMGITLNLESAEGRDLLVRLVKDANVVVESFTPGYLDKLGIGYEGLRRANPALIVVSLTYFGQTGPYAQWHADDLICQAMGGYLYAVTGTQDKPPMGTALYQMEVTAARHAAIATVGSLIRQREMKIGQHIDESVFAAAVSVPGGMVHPYSYNGAIAKRGVSDTNVLDGMHIKTKDGEATLTTAGTAGRPLESWAELLGEPGLLDEKFKTRQGRMKYWKELFDLVQNKLLEWNNLDLMREATNKGIAIGLVQSIKQVLESPHLEARKFWLEIEHPKAGKLKYVGPAFLIDSENPSTGSRPAPLLGQHNAQVYCDRLGLSKDEVAILAATGVV